jgi:hypothetical protein
MNSYDRVLEQIKNESFSSNKLSIAKQYISDRWMTSSQILEIIQLFSFSNDRLDLAKFGYKYVMDPRNYFTVNEGFTFSKDKEELAKFILNNKRN